MKLQVAVFFAICMVAYIQNADAVPPTAASVINDIVTKVKSVKLKHITGISAVKDAFKALINADTKKTGDNADNGHKAINLLKTVFVELKKVTNTTVIANIQVVIDSVTAAQNLLQGAKDFINGIRNDFLADITQGLEGTLAQLRQYLDNFVDLANKTITDANLNKTKVAACQTQLFKDIDEIFANASNEQNMCIKNFTNFTASFNTKIDLLFANTTKAAIAPLLNVQLCMTINQATTGKLIDSTTECNRAAFMACIVLGSQSAIDYTSNFQKLGAEFYISYKTNSRDLSSCLLGTHDTSLQIVRSTGDNFLKCVSNV